MTLAEFIRLFDEIAEEMEMAETMRQSTIKDYIDKLTNDEVLTAFTASAARLTIGEMVKELEGLLKTNELIALVTRLQKYGR